MLGRNLCFDLEIDALRGSNHDLDDNAGLQVCPIGCGLIHPHHEAPRAFPAWRRQEHNEAFSIQQIYLRFATYKISVDSANKSWGSRKDSDMIKILSELQ